MELGLCFVTSPLSWTLLRFCVSVSFLGKVLDLNANLILPGKWPRSSHYSQRALFACFSLFFCPIASLQLSIGKLKLVGIASFLSTSWRSLKESPNKTPYRNIFFEALFDKTICTNARMLRGRKAILFIFLSHSLLTFGSWGNLKVLTLNFEWSSSEVHCELETKTVSNFPASRVSWVLQQWRHKLYFRQLSVSFPDRSTIMKDKKQWL